jgi:hypothetical protein
MASFYHSKGEAIDRVWKPRKTRQSSAFLIFNTLENPVSTDKQFLLSLSHSTMVNIATAFNIPLDEVTISVILESIEGNVPNVEYYSRDMYRDYAPFSNLPFDIQQKLMMEGGSEDRFTSIIRAGLWVKEQQNRGHTIFVADTKGIAQTYDE